MRISWSKTSFPEPSTMETRATRNPPVVYIISQSSAATSSTAVLGLSGAKKEKGCLE